MTASSNWLALQKKIGSANGHRKRRKLSHEPNEVNEPASSPAPPVPSTSTSPSQPRAPAARIEQSLLSDTTIVNGESLSALRSMIYSSRDVETLLEKDRSPGTYIALDCEMVGVGPDGSESSLARVSVVNYTGAALLDVFVRQRERVTDWRTQWSGIRPNDMTNAKSFEDVQKSVASLLDGRILVGHAVHNDLQALMLSHPRAQTRDTQLLAYRNGQTKSRRPALRNLVRDMLGVAIQEGEHSSLIDARATMAIYRLHRKQWDRAFNVNPMRVKAQTESSGAASSSTTAPPSKSSGKRKRTPEGDPEDGPSPGESPPSRRIRSRQTISVAKSGAVQRKGTSSGLSVIVKRNGKKRTLARGSDSGAAKSTSKWWEELTSTSSSANPKGSVKLSTRNSV